MATEFKYWAFVSYSHADRKWGNWLHTALETFRVPQTLAAAPSAGPLPPRIFPIFRDREELPTSADLGSMITQALQQSRCLIVICSPRAAQSRWVNQEILDFKRLGKADRILALIVDGEPNASEGKPGVSPDAECFPEALRFALGADGALDKSRPTEPIAADARPGMDGKSDARLKLIAGILGVNYDDLKRREERRRRRRQRLVVSVSAALVLTFAALAAFALWQWRQATLREAQAESRALAVEALQGTLGDPVAALQKAVQAARKWPTVEAEIALNTVLDGPVVRAILHHPAPVNLADASADGARLLTVSANNAFVWDTATGHLLATLPGPDGAHSDAGISPDGQRIFSVYWRPRASGNGSNAAGSALWDASGRRIADFGNLASARFSPDSKFLVTVGQDGQAKLWDTAGVLQLTLPPSPSPAIWAGFSPDAHLLLVLYQNDRASLWDARTGSLVSQLALQGDDDNDLVDGQFSPDGRLVLLSGYVAKLFDARTGRLLTSMQGENCGIDTALFSPDSKMIVTADAHGNGVIWDAADYTRKNQIGGIGNPRFSPDNRFLLSTAPNNLVAVWDVSSGQAIRDLAGHSAPINASLFLGNGDRIVTASSDHTVRIWDWKGDRAVDNLVCPAGQSVDVEQNPLAAVAEFSAGWVGISPRDGSVASFARGGACLWDLPNHRLAASQNAAGFVNHASFSSDGARIASQSSLGPSVLWDAKSLQSQGSVACSKSTVNDLQFSPDAKRLLAACDDGRVVQWDILSSRVLAELTGHAAAVHRAVYSPDGRRILTAGEDRTARLWDADGGKLLLTLQGHSGPVLDAQFSPDGRHIVTASQDRTARVWDAAGGKLLATLKGHDAEVNIAGFSADGKRIVTAANDPSVRVWDAATGNLLATLQEANDISQAMFSPDGAYVLTHDSAGVRIWNLAEGKARQLPTIDGSAAQFSADGRRLVVVSASGITSTYILDFPQLARRAQQLLPIEAGN